MLVDIFMELIMPDDPDSVADSRRGALSEAHRHWISEGVKGHRPSEAAIERMRQRRLATLASKPPSEAVLERRRVQALKDAGEWVHGNVGREVSEEARERQRLAMTGRSHTPETKEKIAAAKRGKPASKEARRKMSEAQRLRHARKKAEREGETSP
jgi:hypothetical protein